MIESSREPVDCSQQLTRFLANAGYPPAFVEVVRDGAVSVWFWAGATAIQVTQYLLSDLPKLAHEIVLEAQERGVVATRS